MISKCDLKKMEIRIYIQEHPDMHIDDIAKATGYSNSFIRRQFDAVGIKPKSKRVNATIEDVEAYIKEHPKATIKECCAALKVGDVKVLQARTRLGLREVRNRQRHQSDQLCWECKKACNSNECSWVKNYEYPEGCTFRLKNERFGIKKYIRTCPLFVEG